MKINIEEVKIGIKILEDKKTKAIISLDFGDLVIRGFRITESQYENKQGDKLWLIPPSYLGGGRYHPMCFLPNKDLWDNLENRIWNEYKIKKDNHYKKMLGVTDEEW